MSRERSIDEIPDASDLDGADILLVWQDGRTRKIAWAVLLAAILAAVSETSA